MSELIPKHGGYRNTLSFKMARLVFDVTVRFCNRYINRFSRTTDQMIQAARSGTQNIAEGSSASATSKKTELKLTQVARASLEELRLDYEDYLRQNVLQQWDHENPLRQNLIDSRCETADDVADWVKQACRNSALENSNSTKHTDLYPEYSANAALVLLTVACSLLDHQVERQADDFKHEGGFTERLYRVRTEERKREREEGRNKK